MAETFSINGLTYIRTGEETVFTSLDNVGPNWSCVGMNYGPKTGRVVRWTVVKDGKEYVAWIRARATRRDVLNTFMMLHHIK